MTLTPEETQALIAGISAALQEAFKLIEEFKSKSQATDPATPIQHDSDLAGKLEEDDASADTSVDKKFPTS